MSGPLEGVRILDLTRLLPGNYCTLLLSDLGADVIKIEEPGRGDYIRWMAPMVGGEGALHRALNRGKRSATINLKTAEGVDLLKRLVADADALAESFRPGVMERLGIGYDVLTESNPKLVYCAITGYGQNGPYRDRAGHDINYTGYAGVLHATGKRDGPPILPSVQVGDFGGAMWGAIGILAALRQAAQTGRGSFVDVSMLDVVMGAWGPVLSSWYHATGSVPGRGRLPLTGGLACYGVYEAADGKHVAVGALEPQFWRTLCEKLGLPELVDIHLDLSRQDEIASRLREAFATRPRDEWVRELADLDTCVGPVNDIAEALEDPQIIHRGLVAEVGGVPVGPGLPVNITGDQAAEGQGAPGFGQHTEEVLGSIGVEPAEVESLRERGIL